jgi:uncharacterized protein YycO
MITPALDAVYSPAGNIYAGAPGDFFLTVKTSKMFKLISWGQKIRFRGDLARFAKWNHAGLIVGGKGEIVEATHKGVTVGNISQYFDREYIVVTPKVSTQNDIIQEMQFAYWATGKPYGFVTIVGLAIWSLFGGRFDVSLDGTLICSGLVARALERAGYIFERDPSRVTPADLARHFNVS